MTERNTLSERQARAVAENLKRFRGQLSVSMGFDVTQEVLAEMAGLKVDTIRSYEGGKRRPSYVPLARMARVFSRPVEDLLMDEPPARVGQQRTYLARFRIYGAPPPGLADELQTIIKKYERVRRGPVKMGDGTVIDPDFHDVYTPIAEAGPPPGPVSQSTRGRKRRAR